MTSIIGWYGSFLQRITSQLSKWLRDDVVNYPTYGAAASSLTQFFKSKSHLSKASQPVIPMEHQKPRHAFAVAQRNNGSSIKSLIQNAPAAVDAIGISDLVVPVAKLAPKSIAGTKPSSDGPSLLSMMESSSSLSMSKRKRAAPHKTDGTDDFLQSEKAPSDAFKPTVSKPWERTDPYPWKKHAQSQKGGNLGQLLSVHTKSTAVSAVGPSHLIEKHAASEHQKRDSAAPDQSTKKVEVNECNHPDESQNNQEKASSFITSMKTQLPKVRLV